MRDYRAILVTAALVGVSGIVGFSDVAVAEVMDKEPTLVATWAWALVGGTLGFIGWRFRWWVGAALAVLPGAYFVALHSEFSDPYVGSAIATEAGRGYVVGSYCAAAVLVVLHGAGVWRTARASSCRQLTRRRS